MAADGARPRRRWGRAVLLVLGVGFLLVVALVLLALPFRDVPGDAEDARDDLQVAADALRAGEVEAARVRVDSARGHVDRARDVTHGIGGDVWQWVPLAGGTVRDVRHLVEALDDATAIAEIGVEVYPQVLGVDGGALIEGEKVDMDALGSLLGGLTEAGERARSARSALELVDGDAPMIGPRIVAARDDALAEVTPLTKTYDRAEPLLEALPGLLGGDGEQRYLVAVLNAAELRYSGGASLALSKVSLDDGAATFEDAGNLGDAGGTGRELYWKKVPGNPFHERGKTQIQNATRSPYWSTSGEELLRAFAKASRQEYDGMLAIDVPAIASLFSITGPVELDGYGTLDQGNLTQTVVGSYDTYNEIAERRALNSALIPLFRETIFEGGRFADKFEVLADAARGRHFAMYLRDTEVQGVIDDLGLDGNLSDTDRDYLGVFTQNTNASKVDFWQQREVVSDVTLARDGSARVRLRVTVRNTSGPFPYPTPDPGAGYFTRISEPAVGIFFPKDVDIRSTTVQGKPDEIFLRRVGDRPYFSPTIRLDPGESGTVEVVYDVPRAAEVAEDGTLTYRLDVDPQGMVNPQTLGVTVHLPQGYAARGLPPGWKKDDARTATWPVTALVDSPRWELTGRPKG